MNPITLIIATAVLGGLAIILLTGVVYSIYLRAVKEKLKELVEIKQDLEDVQQQLVTQEKLAAVGMLTAGIAHEIKNPLNFINNFSEMNVELMRDLKTELDKIPSMTEENKQYINDLINDMVANSTKITEHGKRAESIVKNMLIQARTSEVEKTPLDVNPLLEEFLNLAYHGMRAQNNKFNAKIEKSLDTSLPKINANVQSLGRVFLNIINNGLYAANEKFEQVNKDFMPTIGISTSQDPQYIIIRIRDNGNGIPKELREKIFEPFFTTKPAGHGTGLGLPICHDIVVKEHGGTLEVDTKAGEYTEFIIKLPKEGVQK